MEIRKHSDISLFNKLGMWEFELASIQNDNLTVIAHCGYPKHFRAELLFSGLEYTACPTYFFDVHFRNATEQEIAALHKYRAVNLYAFEETIPAQGEEPETFFIAAGNVEITAYYAGENLDALLSLQ